MKRSDLLFNVIRLPVDAAMLGLAGVLTYLFRTRILDAFRPVLFEFNLPLGHYLSLVAVVSVLFVLSYAAAGLYSIKQPIRVGQELARIVVASSAGIMAVIIYIFAQQTLFNSRFLVLGGWIMAILCVSFGRLMVRVIQRWLLLRSGVGVHRLILVGNDEAVRRLAQLFRTDRGFGYEMVDHLVGDVPARLVHILEREHIDDVMISDASVSLERVSQMVEDCHEHHVSVKVLPNAYHTLSRHVEVDVLAGQPVLELKRTPLDGWGRVAKRALDIVLASLGLMVGLPLFAVVALAIKINSTGPVIVRLDRVSRNRTFKLLKFRSMIAHDADGTAEGLKPQLTELNERRDGPLFKIHNDPRVTTVGRVIRRTRIDELPQLWNVLCGDISLVGPRPHQPDEIARYAKHHRAVLAIKAGATGMAQVSGSSDLPFEEEVRLDSFYIDNWSLGLDFKIILRTVLKFLVDRSAV